MPKVKITRDKTGLHIFLDRARVPGKDTDTTSTKLKVAQGTHPKAKTPTVSHMQSSPQARQIAERIKEFAKDMSPEKFDGLKTLLNEFLSEESEEPEHKTGDCGCGKTHDGENEIKQSRHLNLSGVNAAMRAGGYDDQFIASSFAGMSPSNKAKYNVTYKVDGMNATGKATVFIWEENGRFVGDY